MRSPHCHDKACSSKDRFYTFLFRDLSHRIFFNSVFLKVHNAKHICILMIKSNQAMLFPVLLTILRSRHSHTHSNLTFPKSDMCKWPLHNHGQGWLSTYHMPSSEQRARCKFRESGIIGLILNVRKVSLRKRK